MCIYMFIGQLHHFIFDFISVYMQCMHLNVNNCTICAERVYERILSFSLHTYILDHWCCLFFFNQQQQTAACIHGFSSSHNSSRTAGVTIHFVLLVSMCVACIHWILYFGSIHERDLQSIEMYDTTANKKQMRHR